MSKSLRQCLPVMLSMALIFALFPTLSHATHSWGGYHWARTGNPLALKLGDNVSSAWDSHLAITASDWSASGVLDASIVAGGAGKPRVCKATSGRVEVCSDRYGNTGWLGVAQIWLSGVHITQGTVKMNDTYFNTSKYNTPAWRNLVMCQEVGHTLGLDHQDENFTNPNLGTCMDYTSDPTAINPDNNQDNEFPNAHDYEELGIIYLHTDSTTTVKQSVNNKPSQANDGPVRLGTAQWGRLIRSTNHGRTELYELNLGRGNKVLTHVIWAEPEE